jgi:hypothetical protein
MFLPVSLLKSSTALALGWWLLWLAWPAIGNAEARVADEYELKAAFLFKLAKFVEWQPGRLPREDSPLVIGVSGQTAFARFEETLEGKLLGRRPLIVRRVKKPSEVRDCHILFVSRDENDQQAKLLEASAAAVVLSFGETDSFLEQGGMVQFVVRENQLRLVIHDRACRNPDLRIMSTAISALVGQGIARVKSS